nr:MAG TPA: hypothetical protein [Caudoviricetes sp.]DAM96493.1 MAG TPA: hypothetical protein [Caudoviricetes sp.]
MVPEIPTGKGTIAKRGSHCRNYHTIISCDWQEQMFVKGGNYG